MGRIRVFPRRSSVRLQVKCKTLLARVFHERLGPVPWIFGVSAALALGWAFICGPTAFSEPNQAAEDSPVVLELFTSQGCSSCPPADALLTELGSSTKGVIPLAYHVDYWNHLGWSDPFSSRRFSQRQSDYARAMKLEGDYTPQMVIDGEWQFVGSNSRGIAHGITVARRTMVLGRVSLHTLPGPSGSHRLRIKVKAQMVRASGTTRSLVMVAIFENALVTKIRRGENGGHEITYDYTVRKLLPAFEFDAAPGASVEKQINVDLDPSWSLSHLGAAAFIQDPVSLRINGAASEYPIAGK